MNHKRALTIIGIALAVLIIVSIWMDYRCSKEDVISDTVIIEQVDTKYVYKTDTVPVVKYITKIREVMIPVTIKDSDSIKLDVIQKVYADSTYTAYVSGLMYDDMPKMDSITVRQSEVTKTVERVITNTIKDKRHWHFGIQAGAGVGVISRKADIYIGIGGMYSF